MMQTRSMVNKPNLTVEISPYVHKAGDDALRKRKRIPRKTEYKSIIQTRSQKLLDPFVEEVVPEQEPLVASSGGDSDPGPGFILAFVAVALFIASMSALAWLYL